VDRSAISTLAAGATAILSDRDAVNRFLANDDDRALVFQRFHNYQDFVNEYMGEERLPFDSERYFYVKHIDVASQCVAILGLNSAWLAASDEDRNCLLIGERQARVALERAGDADIRIAVLHHPFDWLRDFDQHGSAALLSTGCDFILHGHLHKTGTQQLVTPDSGAMIIAAGASYEGREYPNSYNFVQLSTKSGKIVLRRYSDTPPGFWAKDTLTYKNARDGTFVFDYRAVVNN